MSPPCPGPESRTARVVPGAPTAETPTRRITRSGIAAEGGPRSRGSDGTTHEGGRPALTDLPLGRPLRGPEPPVWAACTAGSAGTRTPCPPSNLCSRLLDSYAVTASPRRAPRIDTRAAGTQESTWHTALAGVPPFVLAPADGGGRLWSSPPDPDDETLGAGGLVADLCDLGWRVWWSWPSPPERPPIPPTRSLGVGAWPSSGARSSGRAGPAAVDVLGLPDGRVGDEVDVLASFLAPAGRRGRPLPDHLGARRPPRPRSGGPCRPVRRRRRPGSRREFPIWAWHWAVPTTSRSSEPIVGDLAEPAPVQAQGD